MIYDSILGTIGRTPIVRIQRLAPAKVTLYAKCEFFNPLSSVKDRLAIALIEDAEARGTLKPGQTVIEATSGNTGIALAMVCAAKGYPFVAVMVESFSVERRRIMRMLGAKVILTPAAERGQGMVRKAQELAEKHGWYLARQFDRPGEPGLSPQHHRAGNPVRFCGQAAGLLRQRLGHGRHSDRCRRNAAPRAPARPRSSPPSPRMRRCWPASPSSPHKIQGWTPDFVPAVLNREVAHRIVTVSDAEAIAQARALASREGIFCGISSGATVAAALKIAAEAPQGTVILAMLPDTGERYLSTPLFEGISDGGDSEP